MKNTWKRRLCMGALTLLLCLSFGAAAGATSHETETKTETEQPESQTAAEIRERDCPPASEIFPLKLSIAIGGVSEVSGLAQYINELYRYGVAVVLVAAIVMVVWGGFRYLVGAGVGSIERGKEIIRDAIAGMLIVLAAYLILQTINPATTNLSPPSLPAVGCQPLDLKAVERAGATECNTNADCGDGKTCVSTQTVYEPVSLDAITSGARGAYEEATREGPAATIGGPTNVIIGGIGGYLRNVGRVVKLCSDGSQGAPCGSNANCTGGRICLEDAHICISPTGNPPGTPCAEDEQCASTDCELIVTFNPGRVAGFETHSTCKGAVPEFTISAYRSGGFNIPQRFWCTSNGDCTESDNQCAGPPNLGVKMCVEVEFTAVFDSPIGNPCFLDPSGATVPTACSGFSGTDRTDTVCLVCPPEGGERNWELLRRENDPGLRRIGECKDRDQVGERCGGSAR